MKLVNIHQAKTHLSVLIKEALEGEEVLIAKAGSPQVKLVPVDQGKPVFGTSPGMKIADDFDDPLPEFAEYGP